MFFGQTPFFYIIPFKGAHIIVLSWLIVALVFFLPMSGAADPSDKAGPKPKSEAHPLQKALEQSSLPLRHFGIIVESPSQILYQWNADKSFIPASLIKIFSAGALLELLSPSLTFSTHFMALQKIQKGILNGDLYLRGGGDPAFVSESLWNLVNNLTRTGLKKVTGHLIVDASLFDQQKRGPRLAFSSHSSYDAPVSALSFNWNTVTIYLRPGDQKGQPLRLNIDPSSLYFTAIKNQTKTTKGGKTKLFFARKTTKNNRESLKVRGQMPLEALETRFYKNISNPVIWTGWNAIAFLKQRGIEIKGPVTKGQTPHKARVLAKWKSRPLADQIKLMMKYSNNFMVEMLVKNMAVQLKAPSSFDPNSIPKNVKNSLNPSHLKEGIQIIKQYLQQTGIPEQEYTLIQPSGLSRQNQIKPRHLIKFLKYWQGHPLQAEFESSFPLANEDGTLKKYFNSPSLTGRIRAKTGSLKGVVGLSGYLITHKGEKRLFVFIFNGPPHLTTKAEKLFRTWTKLVFEH